MPKLKPQEVKDYEFLDLNNKKIKLSELFENKKDLILIHNMGASCAYCTMWADGFNGVRRHLENRAGFAVVSNDPPTLQKKFAKSRGWKFKMVSAANNSFTKDMKMGTAQEPMPGVSTFFKQKNKIFLVGKDNFGPGDKYCSVWPFLDLLKTSSNRWEPKFVY